MIALRCIVCDAPFQSKNPAALSCSPACRAVRNRDMQKVYLSKPATKVRRSKLGRERNQRERVARPMHRRNCLRCDSPFETTYHRKRYCSRACLKARPGRDCGKAWPAEPPARKMFCEVCSTPLDTSGLKRKYCSNSCLRKAFRLRHADEGEFEIDGSIKVRDLEECPRRLRLARRVALHDPDALPEEYTEFVPTRWMNPADRRFSR